MHAVEFENTSGSSGSKVQLHNSVDLSVSNRCLADVGIQQFQYTHGKKPRSHSTKRIIKASPDDNFHACDNLRVETNLLS